MKRQMEEIKCERGGNGARKEGGNELNNELNFQDSDQIFLISCKVSSGVGGSTPTCLIPRDLT